MRYKDSRIRLVNEILNGIKVKTYTNVYIQYILCVVFCEMLYGSV